MCYKLFTFSIEVGADACYHKIMQKANPIGLCLMHIIVRLFVFQSTKVSFITDLTSRISLLFNVPSIFTTLTLSIVLI